MKKGKLHLPLALIAVAASFVVWSGEDGVIGSLVLSGPFVLLPAVFLGGAGAILGPHWRKDRTISNAMYKVSALGLGVSLVAFLVLPTVAEWLSPPVDQGWVLYPPLSGSDDYSDQTSVMQGLHGPFMTNVIFGVMVWSVVVTCIGSAGLARCLEQTTGFWLVICGAFLIGAGQVIWLLSVGMLVADPYFGAGFFDSSGGGDPVLFHHLFWLLGHPEFYSAVLTAAVYGGLLWCGGHWLAKNRKWMLLAIYLVAVLALSLFAGAGFSALSMAYRNGLALDSGPAGTIFQLIFHPITRSLALILGGYLIIRRKRGGIGFPRRFELPIGYILHAVLISVFGGITGWVLSNAGTDRALHDTYYVVAHFNFILSFCFWSVVLAVMYRWIADRYPGWLGWAQFVTYAAGTTLIFFPQYFLGMNDMPKRYVDYEAQFDQWHQISAAGYFLTLVSLLLFIVVLAQALWQTLKKNDKRPHD